MIYRFTLISDEVDDFVREIQIDPEATYYDFHEAIVKSVGYTNDQMTSFFICDDDWEKEKEITLEEMDDVKTAVSEAVTNAVIHGYREKCGTVVMELTADRTERSLTVEVADRGTGIKDIKKAMEPMYTTDRSGERSGMGFAFMEAFMDEITVESEAGCGTKVTMKKYIGR